MSEPILQFFRFEHLRPELRDVSKPFSDLARAMEASLPRNPERSVALRKLLEAKDAAVRAMLFQDERAEPSAAAPTPPDRPRPPPTSAPSSGTTRSP